LLAFPILESFVAAARANASARARCAIRATCIGAIRAKGAIRAIGGFRAKVDASPSVPSVHAFANGAAYASAAFQAQVDSSLLRVVPARRAIRAARAQLPTATAPKTRLVQLSIRNKL